MAVVLLWLAGWVGVFQQGNTLWARLPDTALDRYAADQIDSPLPAPLSIAALRTACAGELRGSSVAPLLGRSRLRSALAACLHDDTALAQGADAARAAAAFEAALQQAIVASEAWLEEHDRRLSDIRQSLHGALFAARSRSVAQVGEMTVRTPVGRTEPLERVAGVLRARIETTRAQIREAASLAPPQRLRTLALLAAGLRLTLDPGHVPARPMLVADRASLMDAIEWQRRAHGRVDHGFDPSRLRNLPQTLALAAVVLLALVALRAWRRPAVLAIWAGASLLLAGGALLLTDLALTGPPALRHLVARQFLDVGASPGRVPLDVGVHPSLAVAVWWPLPAIGVLFWSLGRLRGAHARAPALRRAWMVARPDSRSGAWPMLVLGAAGAAGTAALAAAGASAALSEWLILLGCAGMATCLARQAPLVNVGAGVRRDGMWIAAAGLAAALGGSLLRSDLGHALVALAVAVGFAWIAGGCTLRVAIAIATVAAAAAWAASLHEGAPVGPIRWLVDHAPEHARARLLAVFEPLHADASDLARVRWLMRSAGFDGWGLGLVPWQGLATAASADGLPLQGPSDYVLALAVATWGRAGGLALMAGMLAVFFAGAFVGLRTALLPAMPRPARWAAALGGLGCAMVAFKATVSIGGVGGVLPLTGLPVALVGYGPIAHVAALGYLALATGVDPRAGRPVPGKAVAVKGPGRIGSARLGGATLALACAALLAVIFVATDHVLREAGRKSGVERHVASARLELVRAVVASMGPAGASSSANAAHGTPACDAVDRAVGAWNERVGVLLRAAAASARPAMAEWRLDAQRLSANAPPALRGRCEDLGRALHRLVASDAERLVKAWTSDGRPATARGGSLAGSTAGRPTSPRELDFTTSDAWSGLPGCVGNAWRDAFGCNAGGSVADGTADPVESLALDSWMRRELAPRLQLAARQASTTRMVNGREVAVGADHGATLQPELQATAQRIADCLTARADASDCDALRATPSVAASAPVVKPALRAGALALVVVDVDSGRIAAMSGSISDCTLGHLARDARVDADRRTPALLAGDDCAQLPDRRSAWLATQHPALWPVPPGSAVKPLAVAAGMDAGIVTAADDDRWRSILAESHDRLAVQRVALAAGSRFIDILAAAGWRSGAADLLMGTPEQGRGDAAVALHPPRWPATLQSGIEGLRPSRVGLDDVERIRAERLSAAQAHRRHGPQTMAEYVAARRVADSAIGGADMRLTAVGLAQMWQTIDRRARGHATAPQLHLAERSAMPVPARSVEWLQSSTAARLLGVTAGVSASTWKGTAAGACRVVFGTCPAQGLAGLSGKTGTADFLAAEHGAHVDEGSQLPAKLFGGVFTGTNGRRYAVAAMALRVRQADTQTLELGASAAAEAALLLMRDMGVRQQ